MRETNAERQAVRKAAQLASLRVMRQARSVATGAAARSDAGLVPSINNVNTEAFPSESIKVDHLQARCTRLRKNLGVAAKLHSQGGGVAWMLTFTYREDAEWTASDVRNALQRLRVWLKREHGVPLRYIWVMETKERLSGIRRGEIRPHYHCVVWMPAGVTKADLMLDQRGFWTQGMTNVEKAKAAVKYVMKYASKFDNAGAFPRGARCYGVGGLDDVERGCRRWINWPSFVQARASASCKVHRAVGGGWSIRGRHFASEWSLSAIGRGYSRLVRVRKHPATGIEPLGPFSWVGAPIQA